MSRFKNLTLEEIYQLGFNTAKAGKDRECDPFRNVDLSDQDVRERSDDWFRRQVQIGINSANAGNLVSATEVEAKFTARRASTRRRIKAFDN